MAIYCDDVQLLRYIDERIVRDLLSDTGQPVSGSLAANPTLLDILKAASGRLEAAVLVSENYSLSELQAMSDNSKALAADICGTIAKGMLMRRRIGKYTAEQCRAVTQEAEDYLQQLRNGARLFDVGQHAEAGKPSLEFPTTTEITDLNMITQRTKHFYPRPERRLPISRGGV